MKRTLEVLILAALFLLLALVAQAGDGPPTTSGNYLLAACTESVKRMNGDKSADLYDANFCMGYVVAAYQALALIESYAQSDTLCVPDGVTVGQSVRIVQKYLANHPEGLDGESFKLVAPAFVAAFPCESK